jgi:hypothetical protein
LDPSVGATVADGLTSAPLPESDLERAERLGAKAIMLVAEEVGKSDAKEQREEGRAALEELAVRDLYESINAGLLDLEDPVATANELADLRGRVSEEWWEEALHELAKAATGFGDEDLTSDPVAAEHFADYVTYLEQTAEYAAELNTEAERADMIAKLTPAAAEARAREIKAVVSGWQREHGYTRAQAEIHLNEVRRSAAEDFGLDLDALAASDPAKLAKILAAEDAAISSVDRAARERLFQQRLLDEPSSSIGDGLEVLGALGWQKVNDTQLDGPLNQQRVDDFARRRMAGPERARDIRERVSAPAETSVAAGLTGPDGKSVSIDDVTGAKERHRRAQSDARLRSMGMLS